jgi:exodeoxyribonuclease VII small subunit
MDQEITFEQAMARLNEIVQELEKNEKPLNETVDLFEEGLQLVKVCSSRLQDFEQRVENLSAKEAQGSDDGN